MADILRVLYVDDEPGLLDLCKRFLEKDGEFGVDTSPSGMDALVCLGRQQYDAIISDYQMPEMDGISLLRNVREIHADVPFILFTGKGREEIVIEAINNGADFYLQKGGAPVAQFAELKHKVRQAVGKRRAEKKLLENEEKFRTVADYTYGWEYWEAPDLSIFYMSPSCERISGYSPGDFYRTPGLLDTIVDPRDRKVWDTHREESYKTEKTLNVDIRIVRKDGEVRWIHHICHPVFDAESRPNGRRASNRDITDQKRAETDLYRAYEEIAASEEELRAQLDAIREHDATIRASEQKFRETTNNIPGVVFQFVAKSDGSLMLPYVSDRARDILGIDDTRGDMFEPLTSRIHSDDKAGFFASLDEAVRSHSPWRAEARFIKPSGETIWLQGFSSPVQHDGELVFSGVLIDISDRKRGEQALRESEERYRNLVDISPDAVLIHQEGNIVYMNPAGLELVGAASPDDVINKNVFDFIHPDFRDTVRMNIANDLIGEVSPQVELMMCRTNGTSIDVEGRGIKTWFEGRPAVQVAIRDITRRKKNEEALRESEEKFRVIFGVQQIGILMIDALSHEIVELNPVAADMIGLRREEIIGKICHKFICENEWGRCPVGDLGQTIDKAERVLISKDRGRIPVLKTVTRACLGGRSYFVESFIDISQRIKAEEALQKSESNLSSIIRVAPIGIGVVVNRIIQTVNDQICRMTGYNAEELIGKSARFLYPTQEDYDYVGREKYNQIEQTGSGSVETRWQRKDGTIIDILLSSTPINPSDMSAGVTFTALDVSESKRGRKLLQESENKFSSVFYGSPVALTLVSAKDGTFVNVNDAFIRHTGYSRDEVIGKTSEALGLFADSSEREKLAGFMREGRIVEDMEINIRLKTGEIRPCLFSSGIILIGEKPHILSTVRDNLARKQAEEELRQSATLFREIFDKANDIIFLVEISQNGPGRYILVNDKATRILGYTNEEFLAMSPRDIVPEYVQKRIMPDIAKKLSKEGHAIFESCNRKKDGSILPIEVSIHRFHYKDRDVDLSIVRDISDRRIAEEALRESEEKFRLLTENSPDHIFIQDRNLRYTWVLNPQLGLTMEDMLGKTDNDFLSKDDADKLTSVKRKVIETGKTISYETDLSTPQGVPEYFEGAYIPKYDKEGKIDGLMGYFRNISQRKREEQRLSVVNKAFLKFRVDPLENINILTGLAGELLQGTYALYNRLEGGMLCSLAMWNTPPDFAPCDLPEGRICNDVIRAGSKSPTIIPNLLESSYAETDPNVRRYQLETYIGIPVEIGGRSLGSLCIVYQCPYTPSPQDLEILSFLAKAIATEDERRTAGLALRESEAKHRILTEESSDPMFTLSPEGRYIYVNPALAKAFGKPAGEIVGKKISDFFPEKEAEKRYTALNKVFSTGVKSTVEGPVPTARGNRYFLTTITPVKGPSGDVISATCTSIDITERKKAEEALKQSEESYRGLFNSIQQAIYILDGDWKFIDVNEGAENMYGYSREEFMGKTPEFVSAPGKNDMKAVFGQLQKAFAGEPQQFEFWGLRKNNEIFPKDVRLYKGTYFGRDAIIAIGTDITERRNAEVAFHAMVTSMVGTTGTDSLRRITENISSWLGAECVMIGEILPDGQTVRVLSMLLDGKEVHDYSYTLKGTPCDHVAEKGFCLYPDNATQLFPESRDLVELSINGYMGTPLKNSKGQVLGILCALFRNPIVKRPGMQEIMNIIAVKAAAEIEGMRLMAALKQSEEDLAQVMNGVPTLISYMDTELRFVLVNKAHLEWYGRTEEELIGKSLKDLLPRDEFLRMYPYYQQVLSGYEVTVESPTRDKDDRDRVLHVRMIPHKHGEQVVGIFAALEDITERKWAEKKLRESEERYRSNIEQSLDGIMISDEHGDIAIWNNSMVSITGIQPGEAIGRPIWEIMYRLTPEDKKSPELLKSIQETQKNIFELKMEWEGDSREQVIQCPDGALKDVQESSFVIKVGNTLKFGASIRDITERKRAEEAVRQANRKLNLLSGITRHDINNQLTVLQGYLSILRSKYPDPSVGEYIPKITTAAERISSIIRFTKEYEQVGVHSPAWQDFRTIVDTVAREVPLDHVVLKNNLPEGFKVFADPLVVKVCYNLMDNAVRYGGNITTIRFSVENNNGEHLIVCEDDGIGIPEDEKEKIFSLGFGKNTGFGLALSREILDITGIKIRETGQSGRGARFEIVVPEGLWRMS